MKVTEYIQRIKKNEEALTRIELANNQLSNDDVAHLMQVLARHVETAERITFIDFSNNRLTATPDLSMCTALIYLVLDDNQLIVTPDLSMCTALRFLHLDDNRLTMGPDLSNCLALEELHLGNNQLTVAPDLSMCMALKYLVLDNNQLTSAPDLSMCMALEELHFDNNQLTIAPNLSDCTALTNLSLSNNQLVIAPDLSNCLALEYLGLGNNQLMMVPDLSGCIALEQIYLNNNQLTAAPDLSGCIALEKIYLNNNQLITAPDLSTCILLRCIVLDDNQLTTAPDVSNCLKLEYLALRNNQLTSIEIPKSLTFLREVDLTENPLNLASKIGLRALMQFLPNNRDFDDDFLNMPRCISYDGAQMHEITPPEPLGIEMLKDNFGTPEQLANSIRVKYPQMLSFYYARVSALMVLPSNEPLPEVIVDHIMSFLSPLSRKCVARLNVFRSVFDEGSYEQHVIDDYKKIIKTEINMTIERPMIKKLASSSHIKILRLLNIFIHDNHFNSSDLTKVNALGKTPLILAEEHGEEKIASVIKWLLSLSSLTACKNDEAFAVSPEIFDVSQNAIVSFNTTKQALEESRKLYQQGMVHYKAKEYQNALHFFEQALKQQEANVTLPDLDAATLNFNIGSVYFNMQNSTEALAHLQVAYDMRLVLLGFDNEKTLKAKSRLQECERALNVETLLEKGSSPSQNLAQPLVFSMSSPTARISETPSIYEAESKDFLSSRCVII